MTCAQGLVSRNEIFRQRVEDFVKPLRQAEAGRVGAVHDVRVASRRLRELLPVMEVDADQCRRVLELLRQVTRRLGRLRELDVSAKLLDDVRASARGSSIGVRVLRERLVKARRAAFDKAEGKGLSRKLRRTARELAHLADGLPNGAAGRNRRWRWMVDARVVIRAQALLGAMDEAGPAFVPERVHNVRIHLKKLRYAVELAEEANGMPASAELRQLMSAQVQLGRLHDRQVLMVLVAGVRRALGSRDVGAKRDLRALSGDLEAECRVLHLAYVHSRAALRGSCQRILARTEEVGGSGRPTRALNGLRHVRLA